MKFKNKSDLINHHKDLILKDLPKGYEILEEDELSITLTDRIRYIAKKYNLENLLDDFKSNSKAISKEDILKLNKAYQLQFPGNYIDDKLYIIQQRFEQVTDPRNGTDYDRIEYILTEVEEVTDLDNTLYFHGKTGGEKFIEDFGYSSKYHYVLETFFNFCTKN